ncbi:GIY-YIG nuclease family protein [Streptomyces sp. NRRL WC-3742]|uniref:GIY-YIG nuclease family protein n=1 Tax=Streptomyces sp. NRRL WC-3742 TaxID=1463934 RepID=UPI000691C3FC|nr:GIY-YIG nuclease family protein [Streptomyces sp. NRRL WC-3742]
MAQPTEEFVYLITAAGSRTAKIGRSTDPGSRLAALQAGSPVALQLAASFPGGPRLERHLHKAFGSFRIHGEWFDFGDQDPVPMVTRAVEAYEPDPGYEDRAGRFRDPGPALHTLALTGGEWATIDWIREHGGAQSAIRVAPEVVAPDILASTTTVKVALARLVGLNILLKTGPRSGAYQLNPRRFWEGNGTALSAACRRMNAPPIAADEKARMFSMRRR